MRYFWILILLITSCTPYEGPSIKIASFNIQIFGEAKREKLEVMDILTDIACEFDVLAIQEIRDRSETTAGIYVDMINQKCPNREYVMSRRLGRSSSKEIYAIIYNNDTVKILDDYTFNDTWDYFEREPQIVQFKSGIINFTILNNHIKPDDAEYELNKLQIVIDGLDENVIILGDLNADCSYVDETPYYHGFYWHISDYADTTSGKSDCAYDRILSNFEDKILDSDVFRYDLDYNLDEAMTSKVSDHYPVWIELATG